MRNKLLGSLFDGGAFALSAMLAFELRFDFALPAIYLRPMEAALGIWVAAQSAAFIGARVDRENWRYTSAYDAVRIILANSVGSMLGAVIIFVLLGPWGIPR
ncbi:MAG: hypothetical protein ABSC48_15770, partial [Terracidiphilus sp.]